MNPRTAQVSTGDIAPTGRWAADCSVVLVSYRTGPVLLECLASVLRQDAVRQVVLVDNGNPPDLLAEVDRLAAADTRLAVVTGHGNVGFARGCNLGVARTVRPTLLLLNPDTVLEPGVVGAALETLAGREEVALATVRLLNTDGTEQRGCRRNLLTPWNCIVEQLRLASLIPGLSGVNLNTAPVPDHPVEVPCISGAFMLMPRDTWERTGGMDEGYFLHVEDVDFCLRLRRDGGRIVYIPGVSVTHVQGTSRASPVVVEWHKARSLVRYFFIHFRSGWQVLVLPPIAVLAQLRFLAVAPMRTLLWMLRKRRGVHPPAAR